MNLFWLGVVFGVMGTLIIEVVVLIALAVDIQREKVKKEDNKDEER